MRFLKRRFNELTTEGEKIDVFFFGQSRVGQEKLFIARKPLVPIGRRESFPYVPPPVLGVVVGEVDVRLQHHFYVVVFLGISDDSS